MSQLTDSTSDSDSNSSTSWIFVDESNADNEEANKYYLNCSSEPVQELTEKCLNSAGSEIETDSDGISVISESDSGKQILQNDDLGNSSEEIEKEMGMEVIETVGHYASQMEKTNIKLTSENRNSFMWYVIFTIVLVLALIVPRFLSDDELIIENSLNDYEPEIDSKFDEYENNLDMPTMVFDDAPSLGDCQIDVNSELGSKHSETFDGVKTDEERKKFTHKNGKSHDFSSEKRNEKVYSNKQIKFDKKLAKNEKKKKHSDDYKHNNNNNNNNVKDEYKNQQYYDKEIKKRQSQLKKLEKSLKKKEKELNKMKRQLKNLKSKINEELNFLHALKKSKYKEKTRFNKKKHFNAKRFNASLVGDWYYNLYDERDKIRKQEQMANWVFERAEMRSRKRNKAIWYFNWMTDREQLRFKKDFKQFSY